MRLGLLTDPHLRAGRRRRARHNNVFDFAGTVHRFGTALRGFAAQGVDGVALLGDLTDNEDERQALGAVAAAPRLAAAPVLALTGNHDAPAVGAALVEGNRTAADALGGEVLEAPVTDGSVLALAFGDGSPALVLTHFPVLPLAGELAARNLKYAGDHPQRAELQRWVDGLPGPVVVAAGHLHVRAAFADGPRLHLQLGPVIEFPYDATVLDLEDGRVRLQATEMPGAPPDVDTRLMPAEASWRFADGRWVSG